tara:strand:+ start:1018 stop:2034 length:1017 start_codon:yes stop_codon:yes gene_type:complete
MAVYTTIDNPELYFQTKLYTGNGSDGNAITLDGSEDMQPNFLWIKERSTSNSHRVYDSVRGVNAALISNSTAAEDQYAAFGQLESFDSDGFTVGSGTSNGAGTNASSATIVAWCWKESATAGFDIVTFTGNQTARTISHSLSAKPEWLWIKNREKVESWHMQHGALGATQTAESNTTNAFGSGSTIWNDTEPTTSVFSVGTNGNINETGSDIIVYLWASKQGFSKVGGSYVGNGSSDGVYVHLGFRPAFVMIKSSSASSTNWNIYDNKRDGFNGSNENLSANLANAESSGNNRIDILSNGFKVRASTADVGTSSATYIYMAFAEAPFVNSKGVPCNAR